MTMLAPTGSPARRRMRRSVTTILASTAYLVVAIVLVISAQDALDNARLDVQARGPGPALLLAAAILTVGCVVGLLFGVPRLLPASDTGEPTRLGYTANTNLEQISDWLTKILVGVGLVELARIRTSLGALLTALQPAVGAEPEARFLVGMELALFGSFGFLVGYLLSRIWLPRALARSDRLAQTLVKDLRAGTSEFQTAVQGVNDTTSFYAPEMGASRVGLAQNREPLIIVPEPEVEAVTTVEGLLDAIGAQLGAIVGRGPSPAGIDLRSDIDVLRDRGLLPGSTSRTLSDALLVARLHVQDEDPTSQKQILEDGRPLLPALARMQRSSAVVTERYILDRLRDEVPVSWGIQWNYEFGAAAASAAPPTGSPPRIDALVTDELGRQVGVEVRPRIRRAGSEEQIMSLLDLMRELPGDRRIVVVLAGAGAARGALEQALPDRPVVCVDFDFCTGGLVPVVAAAFAATPVPALTGP